MKARLIAIIIVIILGFVLPGRLINSNISVYNGDQRLFVEYALFTSQEFTGGSLEGLANLARKVVSVSDVSTDANPECQFVIGGDETLHHTKNYKAVINIYTIFGIHYGSMEVDCKGAVFSRNY